MNKTLLAQLAAIIKFAASFDMHEARQWIQDRIQAAINAEEAEPVQLDESGLSGIALIRQKIEQMYKNKKGDSAQEQALLNAMLDEVEEKGAARCSGCFNWLDPEGVNSVAIAYFANNCKVPFILCQSCAQKATTSEEGSKNVGFKVKSYNQP